MKKNWLWDKNTSIRRAKKILGNSADSRFIDFSSLLLSRSNVPKEVFKEYLSPKEFCKYWNVIKRRMKRDEWNSPRIEFWQAIYENLMKRYSVKGITILPERKTGKVDPYCFSIGNKIRLLRKEKNITQKMLAKNINISQQMISRIEKGKENVSILTLKKILDDLGAKISIA